MGYACPVCATPQRDGEHLAHHLAFTAMLHDDDHRAWLDEHAPAWETADPAGLAEAVVEHAPPAEYDEVFEDTTDRGRPAVDPAIDGHEHRHGTGVDSGTGAGGSADPLPPDDADPETAAALREARELTRQMYEDATADDTADAASDDTATDDTADAASDDTATDDTADAASDDTDTGSDTSP
ncbi:MAG: hypothetical protein A07HR67_00625 [uncultured archaeon A07HR67]|nr:MAG: hypothetical protein A07HR67_00625 [uncultured archaeon A07HR67]